jgi:hypothetical protein
MKSNVIFVNFHTLLQSKDFVVVLDKILIPEDEHENEDEYEYEDVCQLSTVDNARSKKPVRVAPPPQSTGAPVKIRRGIDTTTRGAVN